MLLCPREDLNICLPMGSKTDVRGYAFLGTSCTEFCSPYVSLCVYVWSSYVGTSLVLLLKKLNLPLHLLGSTCQARPRVETNSEALGHWTNVDQGPL